ncbi:hypothetical protein [Vibrio lentus]|uniref:Uncharacterized protein n=1 Tax=Vibrio lentus TaxID=136468 RepID=A0A855IUZ4_9VIBR|nr:hypothetical protein [Vibrio lentus]PMJ89709.1 hypothetical protein BCU14_25125 [Vibrio lentus]PMM61787.1 hypothetical protein BCT50_18425 [Vibrio lentus]PMN41470.1 hypothetical protein BCT33_15165 [Vibrio lentus]PMN60104.1 hypothetical protein BCT29_22520 [Vibrio lentus]
MEVLISWTRFYGTKLFKNKKIRVGKVKAKQNKVLCAEQLSRRVKEDIGLEYENNDATDYIKYL